MPTVRTRTMTDNKLAAVMAALAAYVTHAKETLDFGLDFAESWHEDFSWLENKAEGMDTRLVRAAQLSDSILSYVVVGLVIIIGILVYSEVQTSLPTPSNTELSEASSNATSDFSSAMELAPLVILVGVAGLILFVVRNF